VRDWHRIESYRVTAEGKCPDCAAAIPGRFEAFEMRRQFGRKRIALAIGR
jgi:pyruvate formate lyase activating enzyme